MCICKFFKDIKCCYVDLLKDVGCDEVSDSIDGRTEIIYSNIYEKIVQFAACMAYSKDSATGAYSQCGCRHLKNIANAHGNCYSFVDYAIYAITGDKMITNTQKIIPSDRMIRSLSDFQGLPVGCLLKCYWIDIGEVKHVMFKYRDNYVVGHNHGQGGKMKLKFQSWWNIDKSGILTKTGYNTQTEFRLYANTSYLINSDKNPKIPVADNIIDVLERSKIKRCIVQ